MGAGRVVGLLIVAAAISVAPPPPPARGQAAGAQEALDARVQAFLDRARNQ